jgi:hypothetical protein
MAKKRERAEAALIRYLTMLEHGDVLERWLLARWPDAKDFLPREEIDRAIDEKMAQGRGTEESRRMAVEAARQRALQKFAVIREHPEIMRELLPRIRGHRAGGGVRYTPEDYAMFEARLRPYIAEH